MKIVAKFARSPSHRRMMMRNLVTNLIEHNQIKTTIVKAKEARRHADKMVGLAKQGNFLLNYYRIQFLLFYFELTIWH